MGLIIKPNNKSKLLINGTPLNLESAYLRIEFYCDSSGKKMSAVFGTFYNKEEFSKNKPLAITFLKDDQIQPLQQLDIELTTGQIQSVETVHNLSKKAFEDLGYIVEIDLI